MSAAIADQVPEAPTQSPAPRRRRGGMFLTALLAATLAAGAGSVLAAQVDEPAPPPAPPPAAGEVGSDAVALRHPADWGPVRAPGIPGLELSDTVAIAPEGAPGTVLVAGRTGPTQAGLLPVELFERLVEPPRAEAVTLGDHEAYRYGDLLLRGESRQVSLYAVPTRDGVVAITCAAPIPAETAMAACEAIATTLELPSGKSVPLGPDTAYARRLDRVLGRLADGREAQLRGLASADTVTGQRIRARELSAVFNRATRAVAALGPGRGLARLHPRLVDALRDVRGAYSALAEAAGDRDRPGYNEARRLVVARERSLSEALGEFERLGYSPAR